LASITVRDFSRHVVQTVPETLQLSYQWVPETILQVVRSLESETGHSLPSNIEVKNVDRFNYALATPSCRDA